MTILTAIAIGTLFAVAVYLMTGAELKGICMGVFLMGHGAHLAMLSASGSPIGRSAPVIDAYTPLAAMADPLPQALILTAIVIGFAVQAFLLTLLVVTWRSTGTLEVAKLKAAPPEDEQNTDEEESH